MQEYRGSLGGRPWVGWLADQATDLPDFMRWLARNEDQRVCVDSEAKGLKLYSHGSDYLRLVQFGTASEAWVIPVELGAAWRRAATDALRQLPALVGHNLISFDGQVFDRHLGFSLEDLCAKTHDTIISSKLIDPRHEHDGGIGAGLKPQSAHFLDPTSPDTAGDLTAVFRSLGLTKETGWAGIPLFHPTYVEYAMLDVIMGSRLYEAHQPEMERRGVRPALYDYEHELARICAVMSRTGMVLDRPYTEGLRAELLEEEEHYAGVALSLGVENINSTRQLAEAFVGMGEVLTERSEKTGNLKVDKAVLLQLADMDGKWKRIGRREPNPLADAVIRSKRAGKWRSAYADNFLSIVDPAGRIHPNVNTLQARTGRMSITNPAVQTLPSGEHKIRRCLLADEGHVMISTDFAAVEMRVLAALANVRRMKEAIRAGEDLHGFTARLVFGDDYTADHRKLCKGVGFGKVYGGGATTIARQTGAPEDDVRRAIQAYDKVYPEIKRQSGRWQREARQTGMVHVSVTGRLLPLDPARAYAVVNYACQSAARDVLGQSLIQMDAAGLLPYLRLPIHDEVLASAPRGEAAEIAREIERCMTFELYGVPIEAEPEIGKRSWGSLYGAAA